MANYHFIPAYLKQRFHVVCRLMLCTIVFSFHTISVNATGTIKPNIVFILADDVGIESMSPYGGSSWKTPNIDQLTKEGMRFANAFSAPSCAPSRSQFLTGRYPFRTGIADPTLPNGPLDEKKEITLATLLKNRGYRTGLAGKWNLRYGDASGRVKAEQIKHIRAHGYMESESFVGHTIDYGDPNIEDSYTPYMINRWACDFISRHASANQPFYLQYSLGLVHWPISPTPLNPNNDPLKDDEKKLYSYMMSYMDRMVGNIILTLEKENTLENTVIFFAGDNGTSMEISSVFKGQIVQGGKLSMRDTGSWVPLYAQWKGVVKPGSVYEGMTDFSDLFPTILEITGAALPTDRIIDGLSFLKQLKGDKQSHRDMVFVNHRGQAFVRDKHWKLLSGGGLFDITQSPYIEAIVNKTNMSKEAAAAGQRLQEFFNNVISR